ncbi:MAG: phosphoribosylglycinamide formyltransferase [Candidatus Bathyarchaeia archaeon]
MRVACFMSGTGTNVMKIIEHQLSYNSRGESCPYETALIFTDVKDERVDRGGGKRCYAKDISERFQIPYACNDIRDFYRSRGHKTTRDLSLRPEFDRITLEKMKGHDVGVIALGGYMSIFTHPVLDAFPGRIINVHPADLSIMEGGERKYVGLHAVRDAILAGERYLYSSTHIVREDVDQGEILMRSRPVEVWLPEDVTLEDLRKRKNQSLLERVVRENQNRLKEKGDWVIFPKTLEMIAQGRYGIDDEGNIYVDVKLAPKGYRL